MKHAAESMTLPGRINGKLAEDVHRLRPFRDRHIREGTSNLIPDILCPVTRTAEGVADHNVIQPACHGAEAAIGCIQRLQTLPELLWAVEWIVLLVEMTLQVQCLKRPTQSQSTYGIIARYPEFWFGHETNSFVALISKLVSLAGK